jgi:hypothetical protein
VPAKAVPAFASETSAVQQCVEADGASRHSTGKIGRIAACAFAHRRRS